MRYFLLDRVTAIETGKRATGIKCVTLTDGVLHDHFPDYPILPGALLTEGLAQLAGMLLELSCNQSDTGPVRRAVLAQINKMKFYRSCGPGDRLDYAADISALRDEAAQVAVCAAVDGKRVASGQLSFALVVIEQESVHSQRRALYRLWTRELDNCPVLR